MPRGPLPKPGARRTNKPTIPTTLLPADGFQGEIPKVPATVPLGKIGRAWWRWAWRTPQAAAWSAGHHVALARRAKLEEQFAETGETRLLSPMLMLDRQFGLTPKALADLRWHLSNAAVTTGEVDADEGQPAGAAHRYSGLKVVIEEPG